MALRNKPSLGKAFGRSSDQPSGGRRQSRVTPEPRRDFFSYHASRQESTTDPAAGRKNAGTPANKSSNWHMQRISTIAVLLVIALCVGYSTTLTSNPRIVIDTPKSTNPLRPIETYQQAGQTILEESIFSKNKLTIRTEHISKQMSQKFPELRDVEVSLPLMGHRPAIKAAAERPALLVASQKGIYVVGESGRVFAKTTDIKSNKGAGGLAVPTVQDEADLDIETGKGVLSGQDVTFITTVVKQFEAKNISIASLTLPALASELHVRISGQPYAIKFSLLTDPRITTGQYFALKKQLDQKGITPAEYIDSRVEERIYYK